MLRRSTAVGSPPRSWAGTNSFTGGLRRSGRWSSARLIAACRPGSTFTDMPKSVCPPRTASGDHHGAMNPRERQVAEDQLAALELLRRAHERRHEIVDIVLGVKQQGRGR